MVTALMQTPETVIFIGRSGCGKGTQAELLKKRIETASSLPIFYLETGARFREFIEKPTITSDLARKIMERSERQPDFLAIWMWSHFLLERATLSEHWMIDGTPRSLSEAEVLAGAMKFYNRGKVTVVYINVSRAWSEARLLARGRADDVRKGDIAKRMDWFENDVVPAVEFFRKNPDCDFLDINGEQTIEEVERELFEKLSLLGKI